MKDENIMAFSMDSFRIDGKVAIVTGGNHDLGEAYAVALAKAGADIFIAHHSADVSRVTEEIGSLGKRIVHLQGDLTDASYREACIRKCMEEYGHIDILINNAGRNHADHLLDFPDEEWMKVVELQLCAVHFFSRAVAKVMAEQGYGKIVNIGSALSFAADPNACAYTAAKHSIIGVTKSFAAELGASGIRCNCIAPGFFMSNMTTQIRAKNPPLFQKVCDRMPLCTDGQWGNVRDLMGTVVFLSSPASDYISGEVITVDGGFKAVLC